MNPALRQIFDAHNEWVENLVGNFERELQSIIASAEARVISELRDKLQVVDGEIARTPANQRTLRQVDRMLTAAMDRAGYPTLCREFANEFPGQMRFLDQMLEEISSTLKIPLSADFTRADQSVLSSQQISTVDMLRTVVDSTAAQAKRKALFSIGALTFADVAEQISVTFSKSIAEAATLAATSMSMFFRTMQEQTFQKVEQGLPENAIKYRYDGPNDKITRPFCRAMLAHAPMTRGTIEDLSNGQLPDPFITGGGWNCRHSWVIEEIKK